MRTPRTRRVLTLALAGAACLALTLTAFAAGGEAAVSRRPWRWPARPAWL